MTDDKSGVTIIPPGTYRLSRDVQNPKPDRRITRDWRYVPTWTAGTEFVVSKCLPLSESHVEELILESGLTGAAAATVRANNDKHTVIELAGDRHKILHRVYTGGHCREWYAALGAALVPCLESVAQFMTRLDCTNDFASWLVGRGVIERGEFERLWRTYQDD